MDAPVLAAEYTVGSATRSATLTITRIANGRREQIACHDVEGKREARQLANSLAARPWNF
jgi:hypothetical protein